MVRTSSLPQEGGVKYCPRLNDTGFGNGDKASVSARATSRHEEFYLMDEMSVFQVENRLFRVHRYLLAENSPVFSSMLSGLRGQPADGNEVEGTSDENPIFLAGATELEFETLLRYFYQGMHLGSYFTLPRAGWIALLSIAHRYEFLKARERALHEVYDPLDQKLLLHQEEEEDHALLISVAEKCDVPLLHMLPSLFELILRPQPLTEAEIARFSALMMSRLAHAREEFRRKVAGQRPRQSREMRKMPKVRRTWIAGALDDIVRSIWTD
ncbi:hypothetical protein BC826DRAFT_1106746 [Russula brevipes]|nr:hypothetical protein BC826DRAFT_1106746 [Russula brevipes]